MDFVFGTLATDELRLLHHKLEHGGVQHLYNITPSDPKPGEPVTLHLITGKNSPAEHAAAYITTDGSAPQGSRGTAANGEVIHFEREQLKWDTLVWGYVTYWSCTLPPKAENTLVRYQISAWDDSGAEAYADSPALKATTERAAKAFFRGEPLPTLPPINPIESTIFSYHVDTFSPPEWAADAIIYHVFVDRFYPGDDREWKQARSLDGFYGGTLWGIRDKLDYIEALGANCIWLSPTFPSPSHHGYDITDYFHVEPRLGGDEALHALVEAAHNRGIRVLLDLVCNHLSHEHPYFQDALKNPSSPYRDWFTFDDSEIGYETFFGVKSMPAINLRNPGARDWMLDIARYWLTEFNVDGYRLDHANGVDLDFWTRFRIACREAKPDAFSFGEVVEASNIQRAYIGRLDGLLDFQVEDALRRTYAYGTWTQAELERFLAGHAAYFPADFIMPTFLDNHDMDRFIFAAGDDVEKLKQAAAVQMELPGPPIIYYGTEVGLSQKLSKNDGVGLEESRQPMPWGEDQDTDLLRYYQQIIRQRNNRS